MPVPRLFIIDASIYFFRCFFSMPNKWHSRDGFPTAAVRGYSIWLKQLLAAERPMRVAACFDESLGTCFRNQLDPGYKRSRPLPDEGLMFQLQAAQEMTDLLGVAVFASPSLEADDLIGILARQHRRKGGACCIVSRDKDLYQLLQPDDLLWDYPHGAKADVASCELRFGVGPDQFAEFLALCGDPADDIPGVPGLGPKTAAWLLRAFGTLDNLFACLDEVRASQKARIAAIADKLSSHRERVLLNRRLTTINVEAELESYDCAPREVNRSALAQRIDELGIGHKKELLKL